MMHENDFPIWFNNYSDWDRSWLKLAHEYRQEFLEKGTDFLKILGGASVILSCLNICYSVMLKNKLIEPLESLSEENKKLLWEEAKQLTGSDDREVLHRMCKAVHGFGQFIQI